MTTPVFLTVDTEFAWRHHAAGLDVDDDLRAGRWSRPALGSPISSTGWREHGLKACFFVDPMPALIFGLDRSAGWSIRYWRPGRRCSFTSTPTGPAARAGDRGAHMRRFALHRICAVRSSAI